MQATASASIVSLYGRAPQIDPVANAGAELFRAVRQLRTQIDQVENEASGSAHAPLVLAKIARLRLAMLSYQASAVAAPSRHVDSRRLLPLPTVELCRMYTAAHDKAFAEVCEGKTPHTHGNAVAIHFGRAIEAALPNGPQVAALTKQLRECVAVMNGEMGCTAPNAPGVLETTTSDAEELLRLLDATKETA